MRIGARRATTPARTYPSRPITDTTNGARAEARLEGNRMAPYTTRPSPAPAIPITAFGSTKRLGEFILSSRVKDLYDVQSALTIRAELRAAPRCDPTRGSARRLQRPVRLRAWQLLVRFRDRNGSTPGVGARFIRHGPPCVRIPICVRWLMPRPQTEDREQTLNYSKHRATSIRAGRRPNTTTRKRRHRAGCLSGETSTTILVARSRSRTSAFQPRPLMISPAADGGKRVSGSVEPFWKTKSSMTSTTGSGSRSRAAAASIATWP